MPQTLRAPTSGWPTSPTRTWLDDVAAALDEEAIGVRSRNFLEECMTFRMQSNGKFAADAGAHDDEVMAWAIAWQMRKYRRPVPTVLEVDGSL